MNKFLIYTLSLLALLSSASCIRDELEDCPPLLVRVAVKDKNYANVNKIDLAEAVSENLPFRDYIHTLSWKLRDASTGAVIAERPVYEITSDDRTLTLDFGKDIPYGDYELTIWGNLEDHSPLGDDHKSISFHPANDAGGDVYITCDRITYDYEHGVHQVDMERTKGKLLIEKINIPAELTRSDRTVSGVYAGMATGFAYHGETFVNSVNPLPGDKRVLTETLLSPSVRENGSKINVSFSGKSRATADYPDPEEVAVTIKRNELTVVRYQWDEEKGAFRIFVMIDAGWTELIHLELE